MPNWCENYLIVKASPEIINNMEEAIKNENLFETFVPILENIKNKVTDDVENWCIENWGTKWDICDPEILRKEVLDTNNAVIIVKFNTAWNPPITFYENLNEKVYEIEAYYAEYGMSIFGKYKDGNTEEYEENEIPDDFWKYIQKLDDNENNCDEEDK